MTSVEITQILTLAGITGAIPTIILGLLSRKGANKKIQIEEGSLGVSVFGAQAKAYQDMLDRVQRSAEIAEAAALQAQKALENALGELNAARLEREAIAVRLDEQGVKLDRLRTLFNQVIARSNIELTKAELSELEATKPEPSRSRK